MTHLDSPTPKPAFCRRGGRISDSQDHAVFGRGEPATSWSRIILVMPRVPQFRQIEDFSVPYVLFLYATVTQLRHTPRAASGGPYSDVRITAVRLSVRTLLMPRR